MTIYNFRFVFGSMQDFTRKKSQNACKILPKRQSKTGICGICLSHDNALSHKTGSLTLFLKEHGDYFLKKSPHPILLI